VNEESSQRPDQDTTPDSAKAEPVEATAAAGPVAGEKNLKVRKILVPVDFSACSVKALQYAVPFSKQFGGRIQLLYVMPIQYFVGSEFGPMDLPMPEAEMREASLRELEALAKREIGAETACDCLVERGQPVHEIVRVAEEGKADLIVLSTHGHTGLKHVLLGSVAENVVRYAPCPVLIVREQEREFIAGKGTPTT